MFIAILLLTIQSNNYKIKQIDTLILILNLILLFSFVITKKLLK